MFEGPGNGRCGQKSESVAVISESFQREVVVAGKRLCACDLGWTPGLDRQRGLECIRCLFRGS